MSYSFKITKQDGKLTLDPDTAIEHIPDGMFFVSGHEDGRWRSISITRSSLDNVSFVQAAGGAASVQPVEPAAPAVAEASN